MGKTKRFASISRRLILYIVLCSSLITLILSGFQLYREYQADITALDRVFERIAKVHFAKQSKGHASIYSEIGKGTTVKVFLPRVSPGRGDAQGNRLDTPEPKRGHERILVVEDDESVRNIPSAILRAAGYEVVEVVDGAQAIQVLRDKPFDLLFTDVVLPGGMNGVEIAAQAKRLLPNIKTLYTTGYTENTVVHNGELDPGVTLVSKPYRRNELLEKVRALLDSEDSNTVA